MSKTIITHQTYRSRESRNRFIADIFGKYLKSSVINVGGGGEKHLLKFIQPLEYLEMDIAGDPDIRVDLESEYPLPAVDNCAET
ncbi:MAG: hypothetical protein P8N92_01335, partial [Burkholderiales bacterium]|nr:hypothetical protein [Burkholderiales bacterium]